MWHRIGLCLVTSTLVFFSGMFCTKTDDEGEIRQLIREGVGMAERQDVSGLMKLTSDDFLILPSETDRKQARRILLWAFRHYGQFRILYPRPSVELRTDGKGASATVTFLIVRKDQSLPNLKELYEDPEGWLQEVGDRADLYRLKLELRKTGGDWLVRRAKLESFTGLGFSEQSLRIFDEETRQTMYHIDGIEQ